MFQLKVFAYSVFYVFFEQYLLIWQTAGVTLLGAGGEDNDLGDWGVGG